MTSRQRAYLKSLAMTMDATIQIGRTGLTPEVTASVEEALAARELVKVNIQKNNPEDLRETAETLAARTRSQVVQVIGRKIVLYRQGKEDKKRIELPKR
ncbi:MAG: ribosome assembly RNA-binding protein YhbY [Lachnospiraceae bacterium]|nr:ribosome assembly RNA-binding protein YhbY [Lachnospiraceae bacterium]MCI1329085.1 ribosome assembly RNA-binding protein YhbY [Lachnospiraceae bacterium]